MLFGLKFRKSIFLKIIGALMVGLASFLIVSCGEKLKKGSAGITFDQINEVNMPESGQWLGHFVRNRNGMSAETNLNLDWFNS